MNRDKLEKIGMKKTVVAAGLMIAASTMLFQGFTETVTGAEFGKTSNVPANDAAFFAVSSPATPNRVPEGYVKENYTVRDIVSEYDLSQPPTGTDLSKEAAAEVGAQALWNLFGVNLEGQTIEMGYQPANEIVPRARWYADVLIDGERRYTFSVDSVTGELLTIGVARVLDVNVSVSFDPALGKDPGEFVALAKQLAEKYGVVHGAVQSAQYAGQGYSNNDPTISVEISGENGEVALMTFSRYDRSLLGISYPPEYKSVRDYGEKLLQRVRKKIQEQEMPDSGDDKAAPVLRGIDLD